MALIECPNCGKKISDSTVICIHCKFNLKKAKTEEKIKKSFSNIPKNLQKQYEYEFCCSNKTFRKIYKSRLNYRLSAIAVSIGGFCALILMISLQIANISKRNLIDFKSPWAIVLTFSMALLLLIEFISFVILLLLRRKLRKDNVIYYTEFSKWLSKNKQLELNCIFDEKEKKLYKILYPRGDN